MRSVARAFCYLDWEMRIDVSMIEKAARSTIEPGGCCRCFGLLLSNIQRIFFWAVFRLGRADHNSGDGPMQRCRGVLPMW